jgi:hypothetical protein
LFILLLGVIRLPEPKLSSEIKAENLFVAPPFANAMLAVVIIFLRLIQRSFFYTILICKFHWLKSKVGN